MSYERMKAETLEKVGMVDEATALADALNFKVPTSMEEGTYNTM